MVSFSVDGGGGFDNVGDDGISGEEDGNSGCGDCGGCIIIIIVLKCCGCEKHRAIVRRGRPCCK